MRVVNSSCSLIYKQTEQQQHEQEQQQQKQQETEL